LVVSLLQSINEELTSGSSPEGDVRDVNYRELVWNQIEKISDDHPFVNCVNENFMHQLVNEPTRKNNFLDLIFSSDENIVDNISVREPFGTSDHRVIEFEIVVSKSKNDNQVQNFNYHKANYNDIIKIAISKQWERINSNSSDDIWGNIKSDLIQIRNDLVPKINQKNKFRCKWATKTVKKCRRAKIRAWNKYIKSGKSLVLYDRYKKKLNRLVKANSDAKK